VNVGIFALVTFRGIVTFSRGGIFTGILMILVFLVFLYFKSGKRQKNLIKGSTIALLITFSITWVVSSEQTSGLIDKRYANQDKTGREKEDLSTGRVDLFLGELEGFTEHPFLGVGASGMKERRKEVLGRGIATHNELSRLLSEHGLFGILILVILILKPFDIWRLNKRNYFFYAFLVFWFATINHSAMRIAAPGFIYALALLNVKHEKKHYLHRKRSV
jgi:O-antigen ligase